MEDSVLFIRVCYTKCNRKRTMIGQQQNSMKLEQKSHIDFYQLICPIHALSICQVNFNFCISIFLLKGSEFNSMRVEEMPERMLDWRRFFFFLFTTFGSSTAYPNNPDNVNWIGRWFAAQACVIWHKQQKPRGIVSCVFFFQFFRIRRMIKGKGKMIFHINRELISFRQLLSRP